MDETLIGLGVFLAGAGSGAALTYLKDRQLLHDYADLVRRLTSALQQQVEQVTMEAQAQAWLLHERAIRVREKSIS